MRARPAVQDAEPDGTNRRGLAYCSCTALMILLSGIYGPELQESSGVALTQSALADCAAEWGRSFVSIAPMLFAFSSIVFGDAVDPAVSRLDDIHAARPIPGVPLGVGAAVFGGCRLLRHVIDHLGAVAEHDEPVTGPQLPARRET